MSLDVSLRQWRAFFQERSTEAIELERNENVFVYLMLLALENLLKNQSEQSLWNAC